MFDVRWEIPVVDFFAVFQTMWDISENLRLAESANEAQHLFDRIEFCFHIELELDKRANIIYIFAICKASLQFLLFIL